MLKVLKKTALKDSLAIMVILFAFTVIFGGAFFMLAGGSLNSILNMSGRAKVLGENEDIGSLAGRKVTVKLDAVVDTYINTWTKDFDGRIYYLGVTPGGNVISVIADEKNQESLSAAYHELYDSVNAGGAVVEQLEIDGTVTAISGQTVNEKAADSLSMFIDSPDFLYQAEKAGFIEAEPVLDSMAEMRNSAENGGRLYAVDTTASAVGHEAASNKNLGFAVTGGFTIVSLVLFLKYFLGIMTGETTRDVKKFLKRNPGANMDGLEADFAGAARITGKFWVGRFYTFWVEGTRAYILDHAGIERVKYFNHNAYTGKGKRRVMKLQIHVHGSSGKNEIPLLPAEAEMALECYRKVAPECVVE